MVTPGLVAPLETQESVLRKELVELLDRMDQQVRAQMVVLAEMVALVGTQPQQE